MIEKYTTIELAIEKAKETPITELRYVRHNEETNNNRIPFVLSHNPSNQNTSDRLSVCLLTFHIFGFFSRTTEPISTKFETEQLYMMGNINPK